jgi:hypothetical protein
MKKLLILTVIAAVTAATSGCSTWDNWFRRGQPCNQCGPNGTTTYMAAPTVSADSGTTYIAPGTIAQ